MTKPEIAVEEIKAILEKYDLAGIVFVQEPKTTAYLHKILGRTVLFSPRV